MNPVVGQAEDTNTPEYIEKGEFKYENVTNGQLIVSRITTILIIPNIV